MELNPIIPPLLPLGRVIQAHTNNAMSLLECQERVGRTRFRVFDTVLFLTLTHLASLGGSLSLDRLTIFSRCRRWH